MFLYPTGYELLDAFPEVPSVRTLNGYPYVGDKDSLTWDSRGLVISTPSTRGYEASGDVIERQGDVKLRIRLTTSMSPFYTGVLTTDNLLSDVDPFPLFVGPPSDDNVVGEVKHFRPPRTTLFSIPHKRTSDKVEEESDRDIVVPKRRRFML